MYNEHPRADQNTQHFDESITHGYKASLVYRNEQGLSNSQVQGLPWLQNAITLLITRIIGFQYCLHVTHNFINSLNGFVFRPAFECGRIEYFDQLSSALYTNIFSQ